MTSQTSDSIRSPWSLRVGGTAWILAGILFAIAPVLAVIFTRLQSDSLARQISSLSTTAEAAAIPEIDRLQEVFDELTRFSGTVWDSIGAFLTPLIIGYGIVALISLVVYIVLSSFTMRGAQWARVFATVLCAISTPAAIIVWLSVASLSWLPLNALWANHIGLALIALQIIGLVLVWLPRSNAYVRSRRNVGRSA